MFRLNQHYLCGVVWLAAAAPLFANPEGVTVRNGTATITVNGHTMDITASHNAFLDWRSFNLATGDTTTFRQPSAASIVWNKITDPNPSRIFGRINANGIVVLMNQAGFYFGPGSVVNAAGFVATTATMLPEFSGGGTWQFHGTPPSASIINYGEIRVASGGSAFLLAEKIENHGTLMAPDGTLGLYAGKEMTISERPDGRGLSLQVRLPEGSVDNHGRLIADAGSIYLNAQTINQGGLLQANSVRQHNGVIELIASDAINLGANSVLTARGDETSTSGGGRIMIKSEGSFADTTGSRILIGGGTRGGDGGHVEISAPEIAVIHSAVDGSAFGGYHGGSLLIDPVNIEIGVVGTGAANTMFYNVNSAFTGLGSIALEATRNITLLTGTTWDLLQSTGVSTPGSLLSLKAGVDLTFQSASILRAGSGWSVDLRAGVDFANPDAFKTTGNLTFQTGSSIEVAGGFASLRAGRNVTLQSASFGSASGPGALSSALLVQAGGDLLVAGQLTTGFGWSPMLSAGVDFSTPDSFKTTGNLTFQAGSSLTVSDGSANLRAGRTITLQNGSFGDSAPAGAPARTLWMQAGGDILVTGQLTTGKGWSPFLSAGVDFGAPDTFKTAGNLTFQSGSSLAVAGGSANLRAANKITLQGSSFGQAAAPGASARTLWVQAGGDILVAGALTTGYGWSPFFSAGSIFSTPDAFKNTGSLTFQSSFDVADGSTRLRAGNKITLPNSSFGAGAVAGAPSRTLWIQAGGDVVATQLKTGYGWSLDAAAGVDFSVPDSFKNSGNLTFQSLLDVAGGSVELRAGNKVSLQSANFGLGGTAGGPAHSLQVQAGGDIAASSALKTGYGWSASFLAGADFATPGTVRSGFGNVSFTGSGSLETRDGSVSLLAGNNVTINSGFVRTVSGGNIEVTATAGSVNTGTKANGFVFLPGSASSPTYMQVSPDLGGISTAAGGNVTITAGQDITSLLPIGTQATDAGSGAFGAAAGNVTLTAGGDITGHYVVRNGIGLINAGQNAGNATKQLALSLANGGWEVHAGQDVMLQEVRNPNGIFNSLGLSTSSTKHFFDYSPDAYVRLFGGNSVQLLGANLPRKAGQFEQSIPMIFAPILEILAGAGGVSLARDLVLFPSASGHLLVATTDRGPMLGTKAGELVSLIVSDSGKRQYTASGDFGADDHATTPIHLNDPNPEPVLLAIAGNLSDVLLVSPAHASIIVGGDMLNSRLSAQNLHPSDVTRIVVAGDIKNQNEFTTVPLASSPDFSYFDHTFPELPATLVSLPGKFSYDPSSHTLTFRGRMTQEQFEALSHLQVQALDPLTGARLFDAQHNPVLQTVTVIRPDVLQALFDASQNVPANAGPGYLIAGPGTFNLNARNLDLGSTLGIQSVGPLYNHALALLGPSGAAINVNLSGNLDMFSTTISSLGGGDVYVNAGGYINVGSSIFTGDTTARGIFTVAKSDVTVIAGGNINVNGSRIAAYDGGNIVVRSLNGNVDAGSGGQGAAEVTEVYVDPNTGRVLTYTATIPGSGILATTFPPPLDLNFPASVNTVGNILVETPRGNIIASAGGIVQLPLNQAKKPKKPKKPTGKPTSKPTITLIAGSKDANGNILYAGSIDASGSGVIGVNVNLQATAGIRGLVVAQDDINISAQQNVNVTALGGGITTVSSGGTISGTIVGVGGVSASANSIEASLLSQNVSTSGNTTAAQVGFAQGNAAGSTSQSAVGNEKEALKAASGNAEEDDTKKRQGGNGPTLAKRVGRVTVVLPKS